MTKKVSFDFPISGSKEWKGHLQVEATVEGHDATIDKVIMQDTSGKKADITHLIDEWCNGLYDSLCDAAINNSIEEPASDDYTMSMQ